MRDYIVFAIGFMIGLMLTFKTQCIVYAAVFIVMFIFYQKDKVQSAGLVLLSLLSMTCFFIFGNIVGNSTYYLNKIFNQDHKYVTIQLNQPQLELVCSLNGVKYFLPDYKINNGKIITNNGLEFDKNSCELKKGE